MSQLGLHNLQKSKGSTKKAKRVGRGNASGKGTYAGRGLKGQRARSGGKSGLARLGVKGYIFKVPKTRGFKSIASAPVTITVDMLEKAFETGEVITPKKLKKVGLIRSTTKAYKVLGKGKLSKKFTVKAHAFTTGAKAQIEAAGGAVEKLVTEAKKATKTKK